MHTSALVSSLADTLHFFHAILRSFQTYYPSPFRYLFHTLLFIFLSSCAGYNE